LAENTAEVAIPLPLVTAMLTLPANVPLAPLPVAANVTFTPLSGLPPASFTVACNSEANAVLTGALWGVPPVAVPLAGPPAVLVRLKLAAGVVSPSQVAVTV